MQEKTREYTEVVEFAVLSDQMHVLVPSSVDIALKESEIADIKESLEQIYGTEEEPAEEPPTIMRARLVHPSSEEYDAARSQVEAWEADRRYRWVLLREQLRRAERTLRSMKEPLPEDIPIRREIFRVRKFTRGEFLRAVAESSVVDRDKGTREEDADKRNNMLLQATLLSWKAQEPGAEPVDRPLPEQIEDLDQQLADVLIRRMLAAHSVSPELLTFLRRSR